MTTEMQPRVARRRRFAVKLRGGLWLLAGATILRVWFDASPALPTAEAQLPDAAKQRITLLQEVRRTNQLLSDIKAFLERGTLNVRVAGADN